MSDFWIHLDGCDKLRAIMKIEALEHNPPSETKQILSICTFMETLSRSTNPYLPPKQWKEGELSAPIDYMLDSSTLCTDDHSLEFTYGISATLARYMKLLNSHLQHLDYYKDHNLSPPVSLLRIISTIRDALETWSIADEPLASVEEGDHETRSLLICHVTAFHAAIVIYLHTRTSWLNRHSNNKSSSQDPASASNILRHHDRICVTSLLAAESLKASCGAQVGWSPMAPIVWPGFIAACEAEPDEQPLWRTWWTGVQQYCIGSIQILWDVVQEVWQRQKDGRVQERPRWMGVLKCSGRRVMSG